MKTTDLRPSPIAGSWYPGNPQQLRKEVQAFLDAAPLTNNLGQLIGLVVPHAGYIYSGATAAHAFKLVSNQVYDQVLILAPSHHHASYPILSSGHLAYQTPLGTVPVAQAALEEIARNLSDQEVDFGFIRNDQEHALEIELPFLQVVLPQGFELIPLMQVSQRRNVVDALSASILAYLNQAGSTKHTLLVASTDLSHFHHLNQAKELDKRFLGALEAMNTDQLYQLSQTGQAEACGLGPVATILQVCQALGANHCQLLDYRTSADSSHDVHSVVGYAAAAITKTE